ncbi:phage tail tape measure protein [Streptomyces sp. B1I3]|uniref:phage tail tape measure protein n=1 Tax=Streptomyces sp. B1I3 TaxID=3042264 RepID=UPI002785DF0C|nr:phage tail tape measure protein [Streptomyces sp. B1I3]MDQ0793555.1 phage-related minor tail protein [Streptomyces sp. B1I3]
MGDNLASGINSGLQDVAQEIKAQLSEGSDVAKTEGRGAGNDFSRQFEGGIKGIGQRFKSLFNGSVADAGSAGSDAGQRFSEGFQSHMQGLGDSMKTGITAAGLAAGAAVGAALLEGASQEASSDKMAAALGLNTKEQKKYGGIAGTLYKQGFGESVGDSQLTVQAVLQGLPEMRNASKKTVSGIAKDIATISDLTGEDAESVVNAAKQLVTSGLAKNHQEATDMIMKGNQLGLNANQDMLDTFKEYSPYFAELGLNGKQALGFLSQGLKGGAKDIDVLGDSLKEFSILAIDGSDSTKGGFKALGLDADKAAAAISKGGPAAAAMTGKVIDGLKKMKDPLAREQTGIALFGSMWEDNSKAIMSTDLSGAAKQVGNLAGTVDKAGKTAYGNATGNFTTFYRTLKQNFVEYIGNTVVPMLVKLGGFIKAHATTFKVLGAAVLTAVAAAYAFRAAMWAIKVAQDAMALVKWIANINLAAARQKIMTAATKAWAVAQRLLNAAMRMNPIGLVITALLALGAIFTILYKKNETFRNLVNTVWAAIKMAIVDTWNNYIKPALVGFWGFIKNTLWPVIQQLWSSVIQPVFSAIGTYIGVIWTLIKGYFNAWKFIITDVLWPVIKGLWTVVSTVFKGIWLAIQGAWVIIKGIFNSIKWVINNVLAPVFRWLWNKVISPVFNGMKTTISNVWNNGIKPIFTALKNFITDKVQPGFKKGIDAIGTIWNSLKKMAAKPINFLIEWVYNKGIRKMINLIPGVKDLKEASPIKFARGGAVNGGIKGKDSVNAMLMPGEHVWTTKEVNALGGQGAMYQLRESVRNGRLSLGETQHYAKGGAVQNPDERVYWDGEPVSRISAAQLALAQDLSNSRIRVMQGSWQPRTSYSGTSHAGPGVVDTAPGNFSQQYWLRRVGFAAWGRNFPGAHTAGSGAHVHSVSRLDPGARGQGQLSQFAHGGDGLGGKDYGPNPSLLPGLLDKLGAFGNLSVYGGSSGDNSSWLSLIGKVKGIITSIKGFVNGGMDKFGAWGGMAADAAKNIGNDAVQYINDKIPNFLLPDNPIPSIFDTGGVLEPGMLAYNASSRPEAVFNHRQFKSFAESAGSANTTNAPSSYEMQITNWDKGTGYIRAVARDEVSANDSFNSTTGRMGRR